jgi:AbrB family looped-hinge helix DNA binding protein
MVRKPEEEQLMKSTITAKFQTTIPKDVRERLKLSIHDAVDWKIEEGKVVVYPVRKDFLQYRNCVKVGAGDIRADIEQARSARAERHR